MARQARYMQQIQGTLKKNRYDHVTKGSNDWELNTLRCQRHVFIAKVLFTWPAWSVIVTCLALSTAWATCCWCYKCKGEKAYNHVRKFKFNKLLQGTQRKNQVVIIENWQNLSNASQKIECMKFAGIKS